MMLSASNGNLPFQGHIFLRHDVVGCVSTRTARHRALGPQHLIPWCYISHDRASDRDGGTNKVSLLVAQRTSSWR